MDEIHGKWWKQLYNYVRYLMTLLMQILFHMNYLVGLKVIIIIIISMIATIDITSSSNIHSGMMVTYENVYEVLKSTTIMYPAPTQGWCEDVVNEIMHLRKDKEDIFKMETSKDPEIILDTAGVRHAFADINFFESPLQRIIPLG